MRFADADNRNEKFYFNFLRNKKINCSVKKNISINDKILIIRYTKIALKHHFQIKIFNTSANKKIRFPSI